MQDCLRSTRPPLGAPPQSCGPPLGSSLLALDFPPVVSSAFAHAVSRPLPSCALGDPLLLRRGPGAVPDGRSAVRGRASTSRTSGRAPPSETSSKAERAERRGRAPAAPPQRPPRWAASWRAHLTHAEPPPFSSLRSLLDDENEEGMAPGTAAQRSASDVQPLQSGPQPRNGGLRRQRRPHPPRQPRTAPRAATSFCSASAPCPAQALSPAAAAPPGWCMVPGAHRPPARDTWCGDGAAAGGAAVPGGRAGRRPSPLGPIQPPCKSAVCDPYGGGGGQLGGPAAALQLPAASRGPSQPASLRVRLHHRRFCCQRPQRHSARWQQGSVKAGATLQIVRIQDADVAPTRYRSLWQARGLPCSRGSSGD